MEEIKCLRCGACCHFIHRNKVFKCRNLLPNNTCRIYESRIGQHCSIFDKKIRCTDRKTSPFDYQGCTFNSGKPMFPSKDSEFRI